MSMHEVEDRDIEIHLTAGNLLIKVAAVTGDTYDLSFEISNVAGSLDLNIDPFTDKEPKVMAFEIPSDNTITGNIFAKKDNIAFTKIDMKIDLNLDTQELLDQFNINLPKLLVKILLPKKIPVTANLIFEFDKPYQLIQFPLNVGSGWEIQGGNISIDGTIESVWLKALNIINNIAKLLGRELIPEEFAKYLPVIDISEFLSDHEVPTVIKIPKINEFFRKKPFEIDNMAQVTVGAGTFNTYDIELVQGVGELYYSPDAEMFAKISGNFHDFNPLITNMQLELISRK